MKVDFKDIQRVMQEIIIYRNSIGLYELSNHESKEHRVIHNGRVRRKDRRNNPRVRR